MKYQQNFRVSGTGRFPLDMLRYDGCYPYTEEDVGKISRSLDGRTFDDEWSISLQRWVVAKHDLPTVERWKSFGWQVAWNSIETRK